MKKKIYLFALATALSAGSLLAQTNNMGIGTTAPDKSAVLDIQSADKGLLIPRMTLQQRNGIQNPANGLMIYQTDLLSGFYFFDGKDWKPLTDATAANATALDADNWSKNGDAVTATNFIGTTNAQPLRFKVQGAFAGLIDNNNATRNTFVGYQTGQNSLSHNYNTAFGWGALITTPTVAANSNTSNSAFGALALRNNTEGIGNVAVGAFSLQTNTLGRYNVGLGISTLPLNTTGGNNLAIGNSTLSSNTTGSWNVAIGSNALNTQTTGKNNVAIGGEAGRLSTGSNNIFIGYNSGRAETGSNKLYLANSSTTMPLIGGDFATGSLKINIKPQVNSDGTVSPAPSSTLGFLAVGDFSDANFSNISKVPVAGNGYRLYVQDGILTEKVKVALKSTTDWADYVFEEDYKRMSLEEVEAFTKQNKHLPNVPSATEMATNGLDVSQTSKMFMEKIEELTLYMIELNKEVKALKEENNKLKKSIK